MPILVLGQSGTASPTPTELTIETVIAQTLSARASVTARASAFTKTPSNTPDLARSAEAAISASDTAQAIASFTKTPCSPNQVPIIIITATSSSLVGEDATRTSVVETVQAAMTQTSQATQTLPTVTPTPCNNPVFRIVTATPMPTLPPTWTPISPTATPMGLCPTYFVQAGDTIVAIAEQAGVTFNALLKANNLTEESVSLLQIGQELLIPVAGCELSANATATAVVAFANRPALSPLQILEIIDAGNVASEGVQIRNSGSSVLDISGWTLTDGIEHIFVFPQMRLFPRAQITVFTRTGTNTPITMFWNLSSAVWLPGTVATISDTNGTLITQYQVN